MGFTGVKALVESSGDLGDLYAYFRKVPVVTTTSGCWYDYSMCPGSPPPQYYAAAPLTAQTMARSTDGGLRHGGNVTPMSKYLRRISVSCVTAGGVPQRMYLLDYLMFYPFFDMGTTDPQTTTNTQTLTRYTDGAGVQMMAVLVAPHSVLADTFTVTYTNSDGVAGRVTPVHTMTTAAVANGTILTTQAVGVARFGPFMTLQSGDTGVRSVQSVACASGTDVGLFTIVLVKPLAELTIRGVDAPTEVDFFLDSGMKLPNIVDDAYLNFITCPSGTIAGAAVNGDLTFIWS